MEALCVNYNNAINKYNDVEPLFLIGEFILSFLCIHPFDDGNGRMSRLLTLLLMYKAGYTVGKYISIEKMIEKTKDSYYKSLYESSQSWEREQNNSMYFINYFIFVIEQVYGQFVKRAIEVTTIKKKKSELVKDIFDNELGRITKSRIKELLPNVSEATIEVALDSLTKKSYIQKFGDRKHAFYIKKNE
ncbi:hypothetical protein FACS1894166_04830 [Bacilli bacterium]|nr:hypothetical protein FACS1894166_04830 [Bacilli bacterium]